MHDYLAGRTHNLDTLSTIMIHYITLEENHIKTENEILLPLVEKYFDKQKLMSVTMNFKNIQSQYVGHLKHLEFYILLTKLYAENRRTFAENY